MLYDEINEVGLALVLCNLLSFAIPFNLGDVALANKAQDCNQIHLNIQQIKIRTLDVATQECRSKIL